MPRHAAPRSRRPGDLLVRGGAMLFAAGAVAVVAVVVPFLAGTRSDAPIALDLVTLLLPVGLGLALFGLLRGARHERRVHRP